MAEPRAQSALTPGALAGKAPRNYGTGRRCACGTKIMQYRKGDRCGLCEDDDDRYQRFATGEATVFGDKWKSKEYPDGCEQCPEGERFKRRHAGRGLCSTHYQRALKEEKRGATTTARTGNGDEQVELEDATGQILLDQHPNPLDYPANDDGAEAFRLAVVADADERLLPGEKIEPDDEPLPCCGGKASPFEDCGGDDCERQDLFAERDLLAGAAYTPNPDGCPRDAHETCCFDPDECNPERESEGRPEPSEATNLEESFETYLMRMHSELLHDHFGTAARAEQALGVFNELVSVAREQAQQIQAVTNQLHEAGIHVAIEPALLQGGYEPDGEVRAMEQLRVALDGLDREAQIRAVRWVTARFEIDRPLPEAQA